MTMNNQSLTTSLRIKLIVFMIAAILFFLSEARNVYLDNKSPWLQILGVGINLYALSSEVRDLVLERRANGSTKGH
jgi:hypothetical protein